MLSSGSKRKDKACWYLARPSTALFGSTKRQSSWKMLGVNLPVKMYLPSARSALRIAATCVEDRPTCFADGASAWPSQRKPHSKGAAAAG
eukprot:CAMPEP_0178443420 /NCGR_PEP_ID=MMETSP0689_2-20121128/38889_1 /TAXON_ID=160604 /ORGANISM="Amphidinium massartii, Strain CS-259" /LENGTH=89 /DNA_ID=CAMNT_0020067433 /DNA_START=182 /DNA_END=448 /DNA_ORIENTATION=+